MKTVHFPHSASLAPTFTTPRPEGHLTLVGLGSRSDHVFGYVLIDSGADYVVLSEHSGLGAGIALPPKPTTTLSGVGGSVPAALMRGIDLEFQGFRIRADVMFDYSNTVDPLFGRSGILALKDLGLDQAEWHWNR
jgi:hypothetical protein